MKTLVYVITAILATLSASPQKDSAVKRKEHYARHHVIACNTSQTPGPETEVRKMRRPQKNPIAVKPPTSKPRRITREGTERVVI